MPPYGCTVLCTDGRSVWATEWFNDYYGEGWTTCNAWCPLPKAPDLGLVWPPKLDDLIKDAKPRESTP